MECKGLFVFKSLILRPAGTFKDAEGKDIEYPASYILKVDQIEENDDVNERKFKVNTKDKESFFEKESESSGPSVDELLKELNLKCETVDGVMPLYELYPGWYDKPEEDVDVY